MASAIGGDEPSAIAVAVGRGTNPTWFLIVDDD